MKKINLYTVNILTNQKLEKADYTKWDWLFSLTLPQYLLGILINDKDLDCKDE